MDRDGGEPDGREGTGGMGLVGGFFGICLTELRMLLELGGVELGPLGGGLSLESIVRGTAVSASLLDWDEESTRGEG